MNLTINVDGGSRGNPGPAGAGVVIRDDAGNVLYQAGIFLGRATNNVAEYRGLIAGLEQAAKLNAAQVEVISDSELLVRQMNGQYRVKNEHLRPLFEQAHSLLTHFKGWKIRHVMREHNTIADGLANKAMDLRKTIELPSADSGLKAKPTSQGSGAVESEAPAKVPGKTATRKNSDAKRQPAKKAASDCPLPFAAPGAGDQAVPAPSFELRTPKSCELLACQFDIAWEEPEENFRRVRALLAGEPIAAGSLIVLPEMFATGFSMNLPAVLEAQAPARQFLADLAREQKSFVLGGVACRAPGGKGLNQAIAVDPSGTEIATFTKLHPFTFAGEHEHFEPGADVVLFDWNGLKVAPLICYDLRFPEVFRRAVLRGANVLAVLANWPAPRHEHWGAMLASRAIENLSYILGVNRCGQSPHNDYAGGSVILDPRGQSLAQAGKGPCVLRAVPDSSAMLEYRRQFPALSDIRTDLLPQ